MIHYSDKIEQKNALEAMGLKAIIMQQCLHFIIQFKLRARITIQINITKLEERRVFFNCCIHEFHIIL